MLNKISAYLKTHFEEQELKNKKNITSVAYIFPKSPVYYLRNKPTKRTIFNCFFDLKFV